MIMLRVNDFIIEVEKKKIKNMYLRILPPDGRIHVSAPIKMKESEIERFILSKEEWIKLQSDKVRRNNSNQVLQYQSGEQIALWGRNLLLVVEESPRSKQVILQGNQIILKVKKSDEFNEREKLMNEFYRKELELQIPDLMLKWEGLIGVKCSSFYIRNMKTRWGTCNVRNKRICFNLQLAKKPFRCLEYVVVHELVHLLEGSHNHIFKRYMDLFLPDWRERKKELNGMN